MSAAATADNQAGDVRPVVPTRDTGRFALIAFIALLALGGLWIFSLMSDQRAVMENNGIGAAPDPATRISSPPPLLLPQEYGRDNLDVRGPLAPVVVRNEPARVAAAPVRIASAPQVSTPASLPQPVQTPPRPEIPPVIYSAPPPPDIGESATAGAGDVARIKAARFVNPSLTVPQGTVIPAVLETALDSTRPGGVRALVQRNVHSFDGSRVLIHRGSRLYGEYDAQLQRGQNRALIRWTRLIRPDGVTIALDSPASDPLGRAGVKGKVDSKFFQRFGGVLLQSVLDIGVGVATREAGNGVIVALPGSTQNASPQISQGEIVPTLKVRHGTSVSVFVSNDLDFSSVEF